MKKQVNHTIRKHFNEVIYNVARYTEILLSVIIFLVIVKASLPLMDELLHMPMRETDMNYYSHFLSNALALVVGGGICQNVMQTYGRNRCGSSVVCHCQTDGGGAFGIGRNAGGSPCHWYFICDSEIPSGKGRKAHKYGTRY